MLSRTIDSQMLVQNRNPRRSRATFVRASANSFNLIGFELEVPSSAHLRFLRAFEKVRDFKGTTVDH